MRTLLVAACSLCRLFSFSQVFPPVSNPQDYFRDPLGIPMSLAANFGELRPNHYHMGLDIRTQRKENLPVYAAADGYVARVSIEPAGFGQAIYIVHPNGYTTVYGHLNKFFPALAAYVREQQYRQQSWQVRLDIPAAVFPVKKGEFIAFSGSTGGSQGPHLHFEIRRTDGDINQNPLLFGLPVPDNTSPTILRLAYYDRGQGIYEQSPHILPVRKDPPAAAARSATAISARSAMSSSTRSAATSHPEPSARSASYSILPGLITVPFTRISFAISAFDTQTGSSNPNGIFEAVLYKDAEPVIGFRMNNISYDNTRNINAHIDYKTREMGGPFLQQLFFLPGYPLPSIYRSPGTGGAPSGDPASNGSPHPTGGSPSTYPADGVLDLSDGRPHDLRIEVKDANGNASELSWRVQYQAPSSPRLLPAPFGKKFYPGMIDGLETSDCAFYLGEKSLYDSVYIDHNVSGYPGSGISLPGGVSAVHTIGASFIPLLDPVLVRLRLVTLSGVDSPGMQANTARIVMVGFHGAEKDVERPEWQGGWASARFHEFGNFQLVEDTVPPVITPQGPLEDADLGRASRIAFIIKDNLDALRHFRAELDGKWLCFTNDKGLAYIYKFDEHCPPGRHILKVSVEDVAGNRTVKEYHFTR